MKIWNKIPRLKLKSFIVVKFRLKITRQVWLLSIPMLVSWFWIAIFLRLTFFFLSTAPLHEPLHKKTCLWEFATRQDSNWPAQPKRQARVLKFLISKYRYYTIQAANNKDTDQTAQADLPAQAHLRICCSHKPSGFLKTWLTWLSLYGVLNVL